MPTTTVCVAHRGGHAGDSKRENTLAAISASLKLGVTAIEIDVWLIEGQLIVAHDRRLGRIIPGDELLSELNLSELQARAASAIGPLPTLVEVIELIAGRARLNIELKGPGTAHPTCELLAAYFAQGQLTPAHFLLSSFDQHQIRLCQEQLPQVPRGVLICGIPLDYSALCRPLAATVLGISLEFVSKALIDDCHQHGIEVWVYTVNHPQDMQALMELGADALFTDYPERLLTLGSVKGGT
ncbi:glycerophosphodiester phosphodiesterase [Halioxenophilus sp. WMMB6]|uniref:glycerophosphodiester phosphodiesterase n=1 Tax=Halioxenophilus sp. WMMB6 TaxID=3073815 RepID=UPI00295EC279|nr:glycerophosphodiester phosphodiesterase [Halioxenophilus sp. WMMB6]